MDVKERYFQKMYYFFFCFSALCLLFIILFYYFLKKKQKEIMFLFSCARSVCLTMVDRVFIRDVLCI